MTTISTFHLKLNMLESYWSWPEKKSTFMLAVHCYIAVTYLENVSCVINKNTIFIAVIDHYKEKKWVTTQGCPLQPPRLLPPSVMEIQPRASRRRDWQQQPNDRNISDDFWSSNRWILNMPFGKWFISSYHHRKCKD